MAAQVAVSPSSSVVGEATFIRIDEGHGLAQGVWASVGVAHQPQRADAGGSSSLCSGFFLQPKLGLASLAGHWGTDSQLRPTPPRPFVIVDISLGIDVGYQWVWPHFFLATVLGASAGWCMGCADGDGVLLDFLGSAADGRYDRYQRFSLGINANMLRIGAAF